MSKEQDHTITVRDARGRYGRIRAQKVLDAKEVSQIKAHFKSLGEPAPKWLSLITSLPQEHGQYVWWRPGQFQADSCTVSLPANLGLDPDSLGWTAMMALREHIKQITAWLRGPGKGIGYWYSEEQAKPGSAHPIFDGSAAIEQFAKQGIRLEREATEQLFETDAYVIYSSTNDAYLTPTHLWKGLNRALILPTLEDAQRQIRAKPSFAQQGAIPVALTMRVNTPKLDAGSLGPKGRKALAIAQAQQMARGVEKAAPGTQRPRKRL